VFTTAKLPRRTTWVSRNTPVLEVVLRLIQPGGGSSDLKLFIDIDTQLLWKLARQAGSYSGFASCLFARLEGE
jgi:hypothetical protein